jgi:hypothetical protein
MENPKIQPDKITKPIQLLAVWFAGLVLLVGLLLAGAKTITEPIWLVPVLAISAILIIPIFLYFVFLLQTKYRPQMQEDTFYSKYLDSSTNKIVQVTEESKIGSNVSEIQNQIIQLTEANKNYLKGIEDLIKNSQSKESINIEDVKKYIDLTNENYNKVESNIKKTQFQISLNRLLPKFAECRLALIKNGFENISEFTGGGNGKLEKFLISAGLNVEPQFILEIVKILKPFGLELINIIDRGVEMEMSLNEIFVGSHAYNLNDRITLNVDDLFIETLTSIRSKEQFHKMFK